MLWEILAISPWKLLLAILLISVYLCSAAKYTDVESDFHAKVPVVFCRDVSRSVCGPLSVPGPGSGRDLVTTGPSTFLRLLLWIEKLLLFIALKALLFPLAFFSYSVDPILSQVVKGFLIWLISRVI